MSTKYNQHPMEQHFHEAREKQRELDIKQTECFESLMTDLFGEGWKQDKWTFDRLDMRRAFNNGWATGAYRKEQP